MTSPAAGPQAAADERTTWRPSLEGALGLLFAALGFAYGTRPLSDNSFFTHLATGRIILDSGVPSADPYSYTAPGADWTVQSWLASALYAGAESLGDLTAVRLENGLVAGLVAWLTWQLTASCRSLVPRILLVAVALSIGNWMWAPRPLMFGFALLAALILVVDGRLRPVWAFPLLLVWTHLHGSFPLGLGYVGLVAVGTLLDERTLPRRELTVLAWAVGGTAAGVLGPDGVDRLVFPLRLLGRSGDLRVLVEWSSPSLSDSWVRIFVVVVIAAVVALVRRPTWRSALPAVVFVAMAASAQRNIPVAVLVLLPVIAERLPSVGRIRSDDRGTVPLAIGVVAVVVAVLAALAVPRDDDLALGAYPIDAIEWLDGQDGREGHVLTDDSTGNLLTFLDEPGWPVFIDDRLDMYPSEVLDDYLTFFRAEDGWEEVLDRWEVDAVVWKADRDITREMRAAAGWTVGYEDDSWVVVCRDGAAGCGA